MLNDNIINSTKIPTIKLIQHKLIHWEPMNSKHFLALLHSPVYIYVQAAILATPVKNAPKSSSKFYDSIVFDWEQ